MHEMIQERRDAKAHGIQRADIFSNLLDANESEKGDSEVLSDLELNGTCPDFLFRQYSHWLRHGRQYCEPFVDNREIYFDRFLVCTACGRTWDD